MKLALAGTALAACLALSTPANAAVLFDFATHPGNVGTTETYSDSGAPGTPLTVTASGFNGSNSPTDLFGKTGAGDESGLGLTNDPLGENEISKGHGYIQLDVGSMLPFASSLSLVRFFMNSTTEGETWNVFGSNANGTAPVGLGLTSGNDEFGHLLPSFGSFRYYDFYETASTGGQNVLLSKLTADVNGSPFSGGVPEPATWITMLLGFGAIGVAMRKKQTVATRVRFA